MTMTTAAPHPAPRRFAIDWDFALALFAYAAASLSDYLITMSGLVQKELREMNPLLQGYIEHFGEVYGLIFPKVLLGVTVVLASSIYIRAMHRRHRTRLRAEHILYPGALFTAVAPASVVILQNWR